MDDLEEIVLDDMIVNNKFSYCRKANGLFFTLEKPLQIVAGKEKSIIRGLFVTTNPARDDPKSNEPLYMMRLIGKNIGCVKSLDFNGFKMVRNHHFVLAELYSLNVEDCKKLPNVYVTEALEDETKVVEKVSKLTDRFSSIVEIKTNPIPFFSNSEKRKMKERMQRAVELFKELEVPNTNEEYDICDYDTCNEDY